jgi:hypothetical protein
MLSLELGKVGFCLHSGRDGIEDFRIENSLNNRPMGISGGQMGSQINGTKIVLFSPNEWCGRLSTSGRFSLTDLQLLPIPDEINHPQADMWSGFVHLLIPNAAPESEVKSCQYPQRIGCVLDMGSFRGNSSLIAVMMIFFCSISLLGLRVFKVLGTK